MEGELDRKLKTIDVTKPETMFAQLAMVIIRIQADNEPSRWSHVAKIRQY